MELLEDAPSSFLAALCEPPAPSSSHPKTASINLTFQAKNRVWGFLETPSGRTCQISHLTRTTATGSENWTYQNALGLAYWQSRDPIAEKGGLNLYAYVGNHPITAIDYFGLMGYDERYYSSGRSYTYFVNGQQVDPFARQPPPAEPQQSGVNADVFPPNPTKPSAGNPESCPCGQHWEPYLPGDSYANASSTTPSAAGAIVGGPLGIGATYAGMTILGFATEGVIPAITLAVGGGVGAVATALDTSALMGSLGHCVKD